MERMRIVFIGIVSVFVLFNISLAQQDIEAQIQQLLQESELYYQRNEVNKALELARQAVELSEHHLEEGDSLHLLSLKRLGTWLV